MQVQPNPNLLRECRLREYQVGRITVARFREALLALVPDLDESDIRYLIREIDTTSGVIEYISAIPKVDF